MDIFKHIRAYILADTGTGGLYSQLGTRVYPVKLPQNVVYPALTIQRISGVRYPPLKGRASLARPRYQFDVWTKEGVANAFSTSQTIGRLLLARLEGRNITVLDDSVSPAEPRLVWFEFDTDQDLFETDGTVSGGYYRYSADYYIWHQTGYGAEA